MNAQLDELINEIEMTQRLLNSALSEYHSIDEKADQNLLAADYGIKIVGGGEEC